MKLYEASFTVTADEDLPDDQLDEMAEQIEGTLDALANTVKTNYPDVRVYWND
jgi:hypothetical protein